MDVIIRLNRGKDVYRPSDHLYGEVTMTAQVDTHFDSIEIYLFGNSRTYMDHVDSRGALNQSAGAHNFLKLSQPDLEQHWHNDKVLKANHQYILPFNFKLPGTLLSTECDHKVACSAVREAHLQLPPSLNDDDDSAVLKAFRRILPKTIEIRYDIFTRVQTTKTKLGVSSPWIIGQSCKKISVETSTSSAQLLSHQNNRAVYRSMYLRQGLLRRKCGSIAIHMTPLEALHIPTRGLTASPCLSNSVTLHLSSFEPDTLLPELVSARAYLETSTYFAVTARGHLPAACIYRHDPTQGMIRNRQGLSTRIVDGITWRVERAASPETHELMEPGLSPLLRKMGTISKHRNSSAKLPVLTTTFDMETSFPSRGMETPTFHSCLISRTYEVKFEMIIRTAGKRSRLSMRLPVRVIPGARENNPRTTRAPGEAVRELGLSGEILPSYDAHEPSDEHLPEYSPHIPHTS